MNLGPYQHESPPLREELDNGTVLLTVPQSSAHSVSCGVWLRHGAQDEPAGLGGIFAWLTEKTAGPADSSAPGVVDSTVWSRSASTASPRD